MGSAVAGLAGTLLDSLRSSNKLPLDSCGVAYGDNRCRSCDARFAPVAGSQVFTVRGSFLPTHHTEVRPSGQNLAPYGLRR